MTPEDILKNYPNWKPSSFLSGFVLDLIEIGINEGRKQGLEEAAEIVESKKKLAGNFLQVQVNTFALSTAEEIRNRASEIMTKEIK